MVSVKKAFDSGERPASQSEHLCRTNANLSDKGTARSHLTMGKSHDEELLPKVLEILRYGSCSRVGSGCNITTVRAPKQTLGADWSGLERTSEPRYFTQLYLAA